jgi:FADH2-dependent halogenase
MNSRDTPHAVASPTGDPWDAIVVGGGPAGSSAAALLARAGRRVLVVERARFPRFHIGESLLPEVTPYLDQIGVRAAVEREGFPVKKGAFLESPTGSAVGYADFRDATRVAATTTWQVRRDRFDQILLDHAAACGATVREETRARDVSFDEQGVTLTLEDAAGHRREERGRFLIDASGRDGFLAKRLDLRRVDPALRHVSFHAWYEGVEPPPEGHEGDLRILSLEGRGWAWLIPVSETRTSVGVVVPKERVDRSTGRTPDERLRELLSEVAPVREAMAGARPVGPARVDGDYSYATTAYTGHRASSRREPWLLAGDAGSFLDPVFSTGVLLALRSGVGAGQTVAAALGGSARETRRALARYERRQRRDYRMLRTLVTDFYRPEFRDFLVFDQEDPAGMREALVTVLAGRLELSLGQRARLALLRAFVWLHGLGVHDIVPRHHGPPSPSGRRADDAFLDEAHPAGPVGPVGEAGA